MHFQHVDVEVLLEVLQVRDIQVCQPAEQRMHVFLRVFVHHGDGGVFEIHE